MMPSGHRNRDPARKQSPGDFLMVGCGGEIQLRPRQFSPFFDGGRDLKGASRTQDIPAETHPQIRPNSAPAVLR